MAEGEDYARQDVFSRSNPGPAKARTRTRVPEPVAGVSSGNPKKPYRKSVTLAGIPDQMLTRDGSPNHIAASRESFGDLPIQTPSTSTEETGEARNHVRYGVNGSGSRPRSPPKDSTYSIDTPNAGPPNGFDGSNWSGETITQVRRDRDTSGKMTTAKLRKHSNSISKPNALSFLDADSPQVNPEGIHRAVRESMRLPSDPAKGTTSSAQNSPFTTNGSRDDAAFDILVDRETDGSNSPERGADGVPKPRMPSEIEARMRAGKRRRQSYGGREMPRGGIPHPHVPSDENTTRGPNQHFVEQLPRTEKLPLTGYDLLASKLSATSGSKQGRYLRPIYRRFEILNHRILLNLQDEICELEEQLHRLDTADTQNRCLPNGILPASRRAESISGSELQWHKTDTIWKIGFKLEQYNRVLSSFRQTCSLPAPTAADLQQYRGYLTSHTPITDVETEFLDATDDLICLGDGEEDTAKEEAKTTPSPPRSDAAEIDSQRRASVQGQTDVSRPQDDKSPSPQGQDDRSNKVGPIKHSSIHLLLAAAVAIVLPILTFAVIPGFMGRMTVVCLVGMGITGALVQGKKIGLPETQECCVSVGLYGCVMALLAGMVN